MALTAAEITAEIAAVFAALKALRAGAASYQMPDGRRVQQHAIPDLVNWLKDLQAMEASAGRRGRSGVAVFQEPT